jgi:nitroimidazol reductase NimA-like FMN-containing flavoprotein (pyridoxamine 5'-phosphate oxidase superfamily)
MRRTDKEIQDRGLIDQIVSRAQVCRLGLSKDDQPYVIPVSFGYDGECLYFHTATEGLKIDHMLSNPRVCFELEHAVRVVPHDHRACQWTVSFYSVIGFGTVREITDAGHKVYALNQIMRHYSGREWELDLQMLDKTRAWCITIESISGKQSKDKIGI